MRLKKTSQVIRVRISASLIILCVLPMHFCMSKPYRHRAMMAYTRDPTGSRTCARARPADALYGHDSGVSQKRQVFEFGIVLCLPMLFARARGRPTFFTDLVVVPHRVDWRLPFRRTASRTWLRLRPFGRTARLNWLRLVR